jgi:methyltransferase (TIGR00027 family)
VALQDFSKTATMTAICRAAHQILDDDPKILNDPIALKFVNEEALSGLRRRDPMLMMLASPFARLHFCLRSRVAEDCMERAAAQDAEQFVILGAGLDSFAYRQPDWAQNCKIVEVDHPKTQQFKIELVKSRALELSDNVIYIAFDFATDSLTDRFEQTSLDARRPIFVSWLGVSQYLPVDTVSRVLRELAAWRGGCGLVMTYALEDWSDLDPIVRTGAERAKEWAASVGEPWLSSYSDSAIVHALRSAGFSAVKPFTVAELQSTYFSRNHAFEASAGPSRIVGAHTSGQDMTWFELDPVR